MPKKTYQKIEDHRIFYFQQSKNYLALRPPFQLPKHVEEDIKDFRPFVKDIIVSFHQYPDELKHDSYDTTFRGRNFELWIANGYDHFKLYKPKKIAFAKNEKQYLWNMYQSFLELKKMERDGMRLDELK